MSGMPRMGQWVGMTMSSLVIENGTPAFSARCRAERTIRVRGSSMYFLVGVCPRLADGRRAREGDTEAEGFSGTPDGIGRNRADFLRIRWVCLLLELVVDVGDEGELLTELPSPFEEGIVSQHQRLLHHHRPGSLEERVKGGVLGADVE